MSVDHIKINLGFRRNLDTAISFYVINESTLINGMVPYPLNLSGKIIQLKLKEKNLTRAPDNETLLIDQEHGSEVLIMYLLLIVVFLSIILWVFDTLDRDPHGLSLPVESVNLVVLLIVEGFLGEVLLVAVHWDDVVVVLNYLLRLVIVEEMVVVLICVVE